MRKKSHIDIVKYFKNTSEFSGDIEKHKLMLYFGSILPDLIPTFIYKRHRIDCTLSIVENEIKKLLECTTINGYYCRHLGILSHYISDYYTLPHNQIYSGSFRQHCTYEGELKLKLREKIKNNNLKIENALQLRGITEENIVSLIVQKHNEYINSLNDRLYNLDEDCNYIICINLIILEMLEYVIFINSNKQFRPVVTV